MTDDELTKILRELRDVRESYAIARQEIPEEPKAVGSFARFIETADRLDDSALQLEGWFDEHGTDELKSPHRYPEGGGWTDDGRFVRLRDERRSWLRRFFSSRPTRPDARKAR